MESLASIAILLQLVMSLLGTAQANPNLTAEKREEIVAFADTAIKTALQAIQDYKVGNSTVGGTISVEPNRIPILEPIPILIPATSTSMPELPVEIPKYTIRLLENNTDTPGLIFQVLDPQGNVEKAYQGVFSPLKEVYLLGQTTGHYINVPRSITYQEQGGANPIYYDPKLGVIYGPLFGSVKDNNPDLVITDGKYTLHVETAKGEIIETQVELSKALNTHYN